MTAPTTGPGGDVEGAAVEQVLATLTPRQRVGQVNQRLLGWHCVRRTGPARSPRYELTDAFHEEVARWDGLGALYGLFRADAWSGRSWSDGILPEHAAGVAQQVQAAVLAASPTGTGALLVEEAPHGHQALGGTLFPTNLGLAASWDPELVQECAAAVSTELRSCGVHVGLVSALDLLRDPRWGRSEECLGENPTLAAELTAALVRGMQGEQRSRVADGSGVAVVLKHLAAQGEGLGGRNGHSAVIGPHDLADIHLPPVQAGVRAGALGMMAAYNDIDGVPCCANPALLQDTLRGELGFDGVVMADGHAVDRLVALTGSEPAAAALALRSGVDLSLWDRSFARLEEALESDPLLSTALESACRRVLTLKARLGLLGGAGHPSPERDDRETVRLSARAAQRSLVLLDDDPDRGIGGLPGALARGGRLLLVGAHADRTTSLLGDYVPPLPDDLDGSVRAALHRRLGGRLEHRPGGDPLAGVDDLGPDDTVVAVVGGTSHRSWDTTFADNGALRSAATEDLPEELRPTAGEGVDRADLSLPGDQVGLLQRLARSPARLVAVVVCGRPHVLTPVLAAADTTLVTFYPGPHGGEAVAAVLLGEQAPVGRLPTTFPSHGGVVPLHEDDRSDAVAVYRDVPEPVLAGLGTAAVTHPLTREPLGARAGAGRVAVRCRVGNPHDRDVEDVLQLWGHRRGGPRWPRRVELLGFRRVTVPAGGSVEVEIGLDADRVWSAAAATTWLWWGPPGGGSTRPTDDGAVVVLTRGAG